MLRLIIFSGILSHFHTCGGYRILLVFPHPSRSHSILGEGYATRLTKAGHDVTYITSNPIMNPPPNLKQIDVSRTMQLNDNIASEYSIERVINREVELQSLSKILDLLFTTTNNTVSNKYVQEILHDLEVTFDVAVVEWMYSEVYAGFSAVFDCPFIWSSSMEPHPLVLSLIDESPSPAYSADHMSTAVPPFNFVERVNELFTYLAFKFIRFLKVSREVEAYRNAFEFAVHKRGRILPPLEEIKYNASLMMGNSHVSSGTAMHLPQNYKPIGGYHIKDEEKPLPEEFKSLMDNATNGVIYFSLGTIMQGRTLPMVIKTELLKTLGELKQTVIWKFEEVLPDIPSNVHIVQWAPQQSILAHSNCVLFITHGGLLSIIESLHYAVPIIGVPLFADQFTNVKRITSKGFGIEVNMDYDMAENLKLALKQVFESSRYREKVKELSMVYHDRPVLPGVELVHWVEHVVRTRGAMHLRSPALMMPWYQKLYLDVIAFTIISILLIVKLIKFTCYYTKVFKSKIILIKKIK